MNLDLDFSPKTYLRANASFQCLSSIILVFGVILLTSGGVIGNIKRSNLAERLSKLDKTDIVSSSMMPFALIMVGVIILVILFLILSCLCMTNTFLSSDITINDGTEGFTIADRLANNPILKPLIEKLTKKKKKKE